MTYLINICTNSLLYGKSTSWPFCFKYTAQEDYLKALLKSYLDSKVEYVFETEQVRICIQNAR